LVYAIGSRRGLPSLHGSVWGSSGITAKTAIVRSLPATLSAVRSWKGVTVGPEFISTTVSGTIPIALKMLTEAHALGAKPLNTRTARSRQYHRNYRWWKLNQGEGKLFFCFCEVYFLTRFTIEARQNCL